MSAQHTPGPAEVISWDIEEHVLTDGSKVFDVVGTSDFCRVTFHCADEQAAEALEQMLGSLAITGSTAEAL